jgi:hypothetical protein
MIDCNVRLVPFNPLIDAGQLKGTLECNWRVFKHSDPINTILQ